MTEIMKTVSLSLFFVIFFESNIFGQVNEDDLFGEPVIQTSTRTIIKTDTIITSDANTSILLDSVSKKIESRNNSLEIGGQLYSQINYYITQNTSAKNIRLDSPHSLDIFLDSRPNDRLRNYVRGRLQHDFTIIPDSTNAYGQTMKQTRVQLDQFWLKFDIVQKLFITLGRQPVRWGVGKLWNPSDFLNQERKDPFAIFDQRLGLGLVKFHLPIESLGWNFYTIANFDQAATTQNIGGAFRAEFLYEQTEVSLSSAIRHNQPFSSGISVSSGLGPIDLKAEWSLYKNIKRKFWEGNFDFNLLEFPAEVSKEEKWLSQTLIGFELPWGYNDNDQVIFGVEYFYNQLGYTDDSLYPWLMYQKSFVPLYIGRHYAGLYSVLLDPFDFNDSTIIITAIGNLNDKSYMTRIQHTLQTLTYLDITSYVNYHFGNEGGEFKFSVDVPPIPGTALENGLNIIPPFFETGIIFALRL